MDRVKVLIADDSSLIRERLVALISQIDQIEIVDEAQNGFETIDAIIKLSPGVLILDMRMPKCNGIEVLEYINKDEPYPIVIVLTNYHYPQYREKCIKAGEHFFFDKSTEFDKVPEVLKELVLRSDMLRENILFN